jgi:hypothetical protein
MPSLDEEIKVGAREAKQKMAAEAIRNINKNRTLIALQLTADESLDPEVVEGLKTMDEVFNKFNPNASIDFEDEEGNQQTEEVYFKNLADFTPKGISQQSDFLMNLELEQDFLGDLIRQLKSNKTLRKILEDPQTKEAFLGALDGWINEIPD